MELTANPESFPDFVSLNTEQQDWIRLVAQSIKGHLRRSYEAEYEARKALNDANMSIEELLALNCLLDSHERAALRRHNH